MEQRSRFAKIFEIKIQFPISISNQHCLCNVLHLAFGESLPRPPLSSLPPPLLSTDGQVRTGQRTASTPQIVYVCMLVRERCPLLPLGHIHVDTHTKRVARTQDVTGSVRPLRYQIRQWKKWGKRKKRIFSPLLSSLFSPEWNTMHPPFPLSKDRPAEAATQRDFFSPSCCRW